ncbi:metalloregulator ArsR/SmtB family transcription factor [Actinomadura scrupuli]|uniref:metalloregulator ArsR/SmtB family transcription factor n=1 Tax=Actinomadura scrupuli TaxID=559629 RepID=UPI003D95EB11
MSKQKSLPVVDLTAGRCCAPLVRAPLGEDEAAELARVLKALADPVRLRLVGLIGARGAGETCVCDLTAAFELTAPTISHHLKVLREAGLISSQRRGTWVYYRLVPGALERLAVLFTPVTAASPVPA